MKQAPRGHRAAWNARLPLLHATLHPQSPREGSAADSSQRLDDIIDIRDRSHIWLALAILTGRLPTDQTVVEVARVAEFDGCAAVWKAVADGTTDESAAWQVRVAHGDVLADVAHTASTVLVTGIQRVARETVRRWLAADGCLPVSWTRDFQSMRDLSDVELRRIMAATAEEDTAERASATVVVPWKCTYLLPELAAELKRTGRLRALAQFSGNRTGVIGFDCVPITSAETTQLGFSALFTSNLAAVRSFDRIAAISGAACAEYLGWKSMLGAIGVAGPEVRAVQLPVEIGETTDADIAAARDRFLVGGLPLVLVVGSHEPRKNHLAVLHAAELLWREGVEFTLTFVGGNSWGGEEFANRLAAMQREGRAVDAVHRLSDAHLWGAYRLARCTIFPSVNEGFGLPVAESLAAGTPAITSAFGSMLEIASEGGALTVDPHDDHQLADALRALLLQDELHDSLVRAAKARPERTWDTYARELWDFLVGDDAQN
ncbi:glycosyltransferase [Cellulomonas chengniuliangii]|uniref:Glycosyltransferase n=1 Tax=Cellulomonas chengniuliangii TaxID=2968084 RepID=A0ABY5KVH1_9CELL|nr:glycosyltransferase [Cellulomonas chengniuliangii]MCC2308727.1 glycosyltransferase [Cellulomonas chengniuliangii]UUI74521.1 glycosyltransferase [Cellulomonas chengniuliangii]